VNDEGTVEDGSWIDPLFLPFFGHVPLQQIMPPNE